MWDSLRLNVHLATMTTGAPYGAVEEGALAVDGGEIAWVGRAHELPGPPETLAREVVDCGGRWMSPGLVDCHTHLVHGGSRAGEFEERLGGATYEEIARRGGGILSTVRATRAAGEAELVASASRRLEDLLAEGVTTVEVKSGYGLDTVTELKMLRAARALGAAHPVTVRTTFLGAHAIPPEHRDDPDRYVDLVCTEMIPAVAGAGLADAADAFCEHIAFDPGQTERVLEAARAHGLPVKLHAEQLSDSGGAALVARLGGLSADHLEHLSEGGARAMASAGVVGVLLPGAYYFLRETHTPPVDLMRRHGVEMAVSTDCNPGSSPVTSLLLMLSMACTFFRLTPEEALAGVTRTAARALGMGDTHGTLEVGKRADLALWEIERPAELAYAVGANPCVEVVREGRVVRRRDGATAA